MGLRLMTLPPMKCSSAGCGLGKDEHHSLGLNFTTDSQRGCGRGCSALGFDRLIGENGAHEPCSAGLAVGIRLWRWLKNRRVCVCVCVPGPPASSLQPSSRASFPSWASCDYHAYPEPEPWGQKYPCRTWTARVVQGVQMQSCPPRGQSRRGELTGQLSSRAGQAPLTLASVWSSAACLTINLMRRAPRH